MMSWERVRTEIREKIGVVAINYPPVNALGYQRIGELGEAIEYLSKSKEVRVCILTGAGKFFVGGADIKELHTLTPETAGGFAGLTTQAFNSIAYLKKPIICAINGDALGQGLELALACDIRIAADTAHLGLPHIKEGLIPWDGGTQRLSRLVGRAKAMEMILTGELIDAQEAYRIGLVNKIVSSQELMPITMEIAREMAKKSPIALRYAKEAINKGMDLSLGQGLRLEADLYFLLHTTKDRTEGIKAFQEKRSPRFEGK
jgi:enoyl-CoA hydratase